MRAMRTRNPWTPAVAAVLAIGLALAGGACAGDDAGGAPDDESARALAPLDSARGAVVALPDGGASGTGAREGLNQIEPTSVEYPNLLSSAPPGVATRTPR